MLFVESGRLRLFLRLGCGETTREPLRVTVDLLWLYVPVTLQGRAGYLQKSILVVQQQHTAAHD
jgi:hypothetical protein